MTDPVSVAILGVFGLTVWGALALTLEMAISDMSDDFVEYRGDAFSPEDDAFSSDFTVVTRWNRLRLPVRILLLPAEAMDRMDSYDWTWLVLKDDAQGDSQ